MDIRVDTIRKDFTRFPALNGVSLDIRSGELIALLGPSGSGKTTLLRLIAGLDVPTSGRIHFGGEDASTMPIQDRGVGFVFQHYALFRHMTVADNIGFGLSVRPGATRPPRAEIRRRAEELLDLVQLKGLGRRFPAQLSGGQRQRVALARALAIEPRVLLLDEPFGALDSKVRRELRSWLRELHEATGHTTVFVTHDQEEAMELADRVVVMREGRIEQVGTPDEIYDAPASPFVFSFVGESSALAVTVSGGSIHFDGKRLPIAPPGLPSGLATLYLRPTDVILSNDPDAIEGRVVSVRRGSGCRRVVLRVGPNAETLEADLPLAWQDDGRPVRVLPRRWQLFPGTLGSGEADRAAA